MDCEGDRLDTQLSLILQMGMIHKEWTGKPTLRIARIAGQYGKPRSKPTEVVEGYGEIMSFKGENINGFDPKDRKWDPERLLQGSWHSAATLNFLRSFSSCVDPMIMSKINITSLSASPSFEKMKASAEKISAK